MISLNQKLLFFFCTTLTFSVSFKVASAGYEEKPAPLVSSERPEQLKDVGIDEKTGTQIDLNLVVTDEDGVERNLGYYFDGKKPVIISPVYYSCPSLCNFHLNGLVDGLKQMDWTPGKQFRVLAISFDANEKASVARAKKEGYMKLYGRPGAEAGFTFLTAKQVTIDQFTQSTGFKFKWNEEIKEWSHASAAMVFSPTGTLNRYLPGILFEGRDIRLALNEATSGTLGTFVDRLVLFCFKYNPHQSKYTIYAFNLMKLCAALTVLFLLVWLGPIWIKSRREKRNMRSV